MNDSLNYKLYKGEIVSNNDTKNEGRKQIRILPYMESVKDDDCLWCSPFLYGVGEPTVLKYLPIPIGTKMYVLSQQDYSFVSGYWVSPWHVKSLFDFDGPKDEIEGLNEVEPNSLTLDNFQFEQDPSGNIYFRNINNGNTGIFHHSGSYTLFDKDGNISINSVGEVSINNGDSSKKVARIEDAVLSDNTVDTTFWTFWQAFFGIVTGPPIPEPGNGAPSAFQTALNLAITGAGGTPSKIDSKVNEGSDTVFAGD